MILSCYVPFATHHHHRNIKVTYHLGKCPAIGKVTELILQVLSNSEMEPIFLRRSEVRHVNYLVQALDARDYLLI